MSGSGREAFLDVRGDLESLSKVREWSGGTPRCPGVVGKPSRMSGIGREALRDVREWSGVPLESPVVVGMPYRMSGNCREALPDVQEWS